MKRKLIFIIVLLPSAFCLLPFAYSQPQTYPSSFIVSKDGTGNFKTIQEAIYAVRDLSQQQVKIFIKPGVYHEKLIIPSWKTNISLVGESRDNTIISFNDHAGKILPQKDYFLKTDTLRTFTSYTLLIVGNDCTVENLTIENNAGRVGQALALHTEGDRLIIKNCKLLGNQDTYYGARDGSRVYFKDCYIEGTTDFIFGEATVVFQSCIIKNLVNSYITAASTRPWTKYGFVFFDCRLMADTAAKKVFLGRPWRPYAKTVFINTEMGAHIVKAGWENWRNPENEKTALYAEYKSYGPGAAPGERVKWSKQLSKKEARKYTIEKIFSGWKPGGEL
jgi:pectinesterase